MQAVLYIAHGSRMKKGITEAIEFITQVQSSVDVPIQEICFLELAHPSIGEGVKTCVEKGATNIAVVPLLLLTAVHAKVDIPNELAKQKSNYPSVHFTYGKTIGVDSRMVKTIYHRMIETGIPPSKRAIVLLIGRGSSDPDAKNDLLQIASRLKEMYSFKEVQVSFLYGASPTFDEALSHLKQNNHSQVFIVPYLLFSGLLLNGIRKKLHDSPYILTESLGYHENVKNVCIDRVKAAYQPVIYL